MPDPRRVGCAARYSRSTRSSVRTSRSVPQRRHPRFGLRLRTGSQVNQSGALRRAAARRASRPPFGAPAGARAAPARCRSPAAGRWQGCWVERRRCRSHRRGSGIVGGRSDGRGRPGGGAQHQREQHGWPGTRGGVSTAACPGGAASGQGGDRAVSGPASAAGASRRMPARPRGSPPSGSRTRAAPRARARSRGPARPPRRAARAARACCPASDSGALAAISAA